MEIIDAHTHFQSYNYFRLLTQQRAEYGDIDEFIEERARKFSFTVPPTDPVRLADLWAIEMDRYKVSRCVAMASAMGDGASVAAALRVYPDRFIGAVAVNPYLSVAEELIEHHVEEWGFRAIVLYPSLHRFMASSERVYPIYQMARKYRLAVYVHFGTLRIPPRRWWDLPLLYDPHYADPGDLHKAATDFPSVKFIIPSFGSGSFKALLRLGLQCPNVNVDTSSSNSWLMDQSAFRSLQEVFQRTLEVFGPARMLFGTDSGMFPRGWRHAIYTEQMEILKSLGLSENARAAILSQNAAQMFGIERGLFG